MPMLMPNEHPDSAALLPFPLYHGTDAVIDTDTDTLRPSRGGLYGPGIYLSEHRGEAGIHGDTVLEAQVRMRHPYVVEDHAWLMAQARDPGFQQRLRSLGHDGICCTSSATWVVFDPDQIVRLQEHTPQQARQDRPRY